MADSFAVFQAAARSGARAHTILALQPLTSSLFENALVDLRSRTAEKSSGSARMGSDGRHQSRVSAFVDANGVAEAHCDTGTALSQSLLQAFQTNPKLLLDPLATTTTFNGTAAAATAATAHVCPSPKAIPLKSRVAATAAHVPPLNLSGIQKKSWNEAALSACTLPTIPATPLTARAEWLRRGGGLILKNESALSQTKQLDKGTEHACLESDAVTEVFQLLHEKQQRLQQPLTDTVGVQYRSLKCPSPDLGYRVVFNGSNNFNRYNPFDTVRIVSARSSRTILDRAVAPFSERQVLPRRPHHGEYITYREDFFDDDVSRATTGTRSSSRGRSVPRAATAKTAAFRNLQSKLDALESIALKALSMQAQPPSVPRFADAPFRPPPVTRSSLLADSTAAALAQASHTATPPPKVAPVPESPRARRVSSWAAQGR